MRKIHKVTRNGIVYGYIYYTPGVKDCYIFLQKGMNRGPRSSKIENLADILKKDNFTIL